MKKRLLLCIFLLQNLLFSQTQNAVASSLDFDVESLISEANKIYSAEKTAYISNVSSILKNNKMPDIYANEVIKDLVNDIDNNLLSISNVHKSIDSHTKTISQVMSNTNFSNVPGLQGVADIAIDKMKDGQSYENLVTQVNNKLVERFCSGEELSNCSNEQIVKSMESFKTMLPKSEFEIASFSHNGKNNAKVQIQGQCACNPVMQRAYENMSKFIVDDNLSQIPSKIDSIIKEVENRTKNLEEENKSLDSLIANTKILSLDLQKLKFELNKENNLNYLE